MTKIIKIKPWTECSDSFSKHRFISEFILLLIQCIPTGDHVLISQRSPLGIWYLYQANDRHDMPLILGRIVDPI